jgi:hypothetical protein
MSVSHHKQTGWIHYCIHDYIMPRALALDRLSDLLVIAGRVETAL